MLAKTDIDVAPWYIARSDDKKRARFNVISHLLGATPYEPVPRDHVKLPNRQKSEGYPEPGHPCKLVPERFRARRVTAGKRTTSPSDSVSWSRDYVHA